MQVPVEHADAGAFMLSEIREQPAALRRLLEQADVIHSVAEHLTAARPQVVRLVGHGTSDNAATYGVYAFGILCGWTALRDSISLTVYYDAPLDMRGSAVIALSQSGQTGDVVAYVERARARGALTVAVTNDVTSELAEAAQFVIPLQAGPECSVAATKTYVNSLAALALLAGHIATRGRAFVDVLRATTEVVDATIAELEPVVAAAAAELAPIARMFVIARGLELATAREIGLKLQETCRVAADALSATDLSHGPVSAIDPEFPVWAIGTVAGEDLAAVLEATRRAQRAGAILVATGTAAHAMDGAAYRFPTPKAPHPVLAPLVSVLPGQLFAHALSLAAGYDPDRPQNLTKVTSVP
jgi:glutamine---fructose-6-phosphate transaminase (isomerizing)